MAVPLVDSFTDTNGTSLADHDPDTGDTGSWQPLSFRVVGTNVENVREFDDDEDDIVRASGALSDMEYGTILMIVKNSDDGHTHPWALRFSNGDPGIEIYFDGDEIGMYDDVSEDDVDGGVDLGQGIWWLIVVRKEDGDETPRVTYYSYATDSWQSEGLDSDLDNWDAVGVGGEVCFTFDDGSDAFIGRIAVQACWSNDLPWSDDAAGDAAIQASGMHLALSEILDAEPSSAWRFDQRQTGTDVDDLTGNGADQNSVSGTNVATGDNPPGFDFGSADWGTDTIIQSGGVQSEGSGSGTDAQGLVHRNSTDPGTDEYDVNVTMSFDSSSDQRLHAVWFRMDPEGTISDRMNGYTLFGVGDSTQEWQLWKSVDGVATELDSASASLAGNSFDIRIEVRADGVEVFVDEVSTLTTGDTDITQRGRVGIGTSRGSSTHFIDDLSVGTASDVEGTLAADLPAVQGSFAGQNDIEGELEAELAPVGGSFTGEIDTQGEVDGTFAAITGSFTGESDENEVEAELDGTLPSLVAAFSGGAVTEGELDANLPAVTGSFTGEMDLIVTAALQGVLPALSGSLTGDPARDDLRPQPVDVRPRRGSLGSRAFPSRWRDLRRSGTF